MRNGAEVGRAVLLDFYRIDLEHPYAIDYSVVFTCPRIIEDSAPRDAEGVHGWKAWAQNSPGGAQSRLPEQCRKVLLVLLGRFEGIDVNGVVRCCQ